MKKFIFLLVFVTGICCGVFAQDNKDKVKKTSTLPQKVHKTFSRHKQHKGYKTRHEHNGVIWKHKVDYKHGEVKDKKS
jgi:hypothetical protein